MMISESEQYNDDVPHLLAGIVAENTITKLLETCTNILSQEQIKELESRWRTSLHNMNCLPEPRPLPKLTVSTHPRLTEDCMPIKLVRRRCGVPDPYLSPDALMQRAPGAYLEYVATKKRKVASQDISCSEPLQYCDTAPPVQYTANAPSGASTPELGMFVNVCEINTSNVLSGRVCGVSVHSSGVIVRVRGAVHDRDIDAMWQKSNSLQSQAVTAPPIDTTQDDEDALLSYLVGDDEESWSGYAALTNNIADADITVSDVTNCSDDIEQYFASLGDTPINAVIHLPADISNDVSLTSEEDPSIPLAAPSNIIVGTTARLRREIKAWHILMDNAILRINNKERVVRRLKLEIAIPASLLTR